MSRFFKKSTLADKADKVWSESKTEFKSTHPTQNEIKLEKKSLDDVLEKLKSDAPEKQQEEKVDFVFGSKLGDRIVQTDESSKTKENDEKQLSASELFKTARADAPKESEGVNFREAAKEEAEKTKELGKQHASTSIVSITTGEEQECAIFQASCKLHAFDKEKKTYVEKGICDLKINQTTEKGFVHHRIIARTKGTLKVVINSKIFADMIVEKVDRRLKISAIGPDNVGVQIFLIKFGFSKTDSGADAERFLEILSNLLKLEKGEQCRKRKAVCDVNPESLKLKDSKRDEEAKPEEESAPKKDDSEEQDSPESPSPSILEEEGFVIVRSPNEEEGTEEEGTSV